MDEGGALFSFTSQEFPHKNCIFLALVLEYTRLNGHLSELPFPLRRIQRESYSCKDIHSYQTNHRFPAESGGYHRAESGAACSGALHQIGLPGTCALPSEARRQEQGTL